MLKKIICAGFALLLASTSTLAGSITINANDFAVGTVLGNKGGITFTSETFSNGEISRSEVATRILQSSSNGTNYYQYNDFGASGEIFGLYIKENFGVTDETLHYANLLSINFSSESTFTSFKIKGEGSSGSPVGLLAYDKNGNFRSSAFIGATGSRNEYGSFGYFFDRDFGFELGSVKVGSLSDHAHFYEITASVTEPSVLHLLILGLLLIIFRQKFSLAK